MLNINSHHPLILYNSLFLISNSHQLLIGMIFHKKRKLVWPYILLFVVLVVGVTGFLVFRFVSNLTPEQILESPFLREQVKNFGGEDIDDELFDILPDLMGFSGSKTYLLLFLNNTELRPGGGFIGSYGVVKVADAHPEVLVIDGTENLDRNTPDFWRPVPPKVITEHLGVDRWYFRDSNWSPDFQESTKKSLEFYKAEGGIASSDIDGVIGITPTVLEGLMELTGPFTVEGITFTSENVTEALEYEVEYGYLDRGIDVMDRKKIMGVFLDQLISHLKRNALTNLSLYLPTVTNLLDEKHIIVSMNDEDLQRVFDEQGWNGEISKTKKDYLLWVDANLAALKTDHAMERNLTYSFEKLDDGRYVAEAKMEYIHNGVFDWRTSRYLSYARVFVPRGSELVEVVGSNKNIDEGEELDKQWFGAFVSVEPGETKSIVFRYILPNEVFSVDMYKLVVQKQLGTLDHGLTLDLDFGTNIDRAIPAEENKNWGDSRYVVDTDLVLDRDFEVEL